MTTLWEHGLPVSEVMTAVIGPLVIDLASYIEVPEADLAESRVYDPQRTPEQEQMFPPLLKGRCGSTPPGDAHVAVNYRPQ